MLNRRFREKLPEPAKKSLVVHPLSLPQFVLLIEHVPGFAFARLSDGGFFCLQDRKGKNCDGVIYTLSQSASLRAVIEDETLVHGITSIAIHAANAAVWLSEQGLDEVEWYDADVMNKASDTGTLKPFIDCLRKRKNVLCGTQHLRNFPGIPLAAFVECHGSQAFEEVDELEAEIVYRVEQTQADTVLLSAGQGASPTLVSRLHKIFPEIVIIDTGSLWDPYVGVFSRSGHKRTGLEGYKRLGRLNFGQDISQW